MLARLRFLSTCVLQFSIIVCACEMRVGNRLSRPTSAQVGTGVLQGQLTAERALFEQPVRFAQPFAQRPRVVSYLRYSVLL